jgi:small subunit ribosomal protein S4
MIDNSCRRCRQVGEKLCCSIKCASAKRELSSGQHGKKPSMRKLSEYGKQLREKQKAKFVYGVLEAQFRRFFEAATHQKGATGENLLSLLERRLDNVVYRLKMASSRRQSHQMIVHGHITVNGKRAASPSYVVSIGDEIGFVESSLKHPTFVENVINKRLGLAIKVPEWLELKKKDFKGTVLRLPVRADINVPIEEHLIVELYSKC